MTHELPFRIALAALLGLVAAGGNLLGGYFVVYREWPRRYLQYFLALGAGYMLSVAFVEVIPESLRLAGENALLYVLGGFFLIHLFEHTIAPHFHFGEETHTEEMHGHHARSTVLLGLAIHTFFDGVAIAAGFLVSTWLGVVIFVAVFLHKLPEGFTVASVVLASGQGKRRRGSGGRTVGSGDAGGGIADERAAGRIEVCAAAIRGSDGVRGGHGPVAGGEPGAGLADGGAGFCGSGQHVDFKRVIQVLSGRRRGPVAYRGYAGQTATF